ncbi:MAG: exodeoxyribonuclease VII small subunit [Clostridia bacterium]|nr:exodeoxyribonuclease VII small subunit [Clostridia bacterium]MBR5768696.1 exodeoxyribonuclease VII small subunit [Clostridia bacterium]
MSEISFETAIKQLEEIVKSLENGDIPLDEALALFEKGVKLTELCSAKLNAAEKQIKLLVKDGEEMKKEDFTANE